VAEVFCADEQSDHPVELERWAALAERVLEAEGVGADVELSLVFLEEPAMAELNNRFRGKNEPTDVLSFPIDEEPVESGRHPDSGGSGPGEGAEPDDVPVLLGDVYVCPAVAARNAPEHAGTYIDEIALLVVHGILHLLGMDHEDDEEAEEMEARERALLAALHVGDGPVPPPRPARPWLPPRSGDAVTADLLRRGELPGTPDPDEEDEA
jgi:probable rRNA maturation factor